MGNFNQDPTIARPASEVSEATLIESMRFDFVALREQRDALAARGSWDQVKELEEVSASVDTLADQIVDKASEMAGSAENGWDDVGVSIATAEAKAKAEAEAASKLPQKVTTISYKTSLGDPNRRY